MTKFSKSGQIYSILISAWWKLIKFKINCDGNKCISCWLAILDRIIHAQHSVLLQKNVLPKQLEGKTPLSGRETLLSLLYMHLCHQFPALLNLSLINANLIFNNITEQNMSGQFPLAMQFLFASLWRNLLVSWRKECPYLPKGWDNVKCDTPIEVI